MPDKRDENLVDRDAFEREINTDLDEETPDKPKGMALHNKILIGLAVGVIAGVTVNKLFGGDHAKVVWVVDNITQPVGQLFLRLLLMIVVPLLSYAICRPEVKHSPEISDWAAKELAEMGPMSRNEWIMLVLIILAMFLWIAGSSPDIHVPLLLWWAIEAQAEAHRDAVLAMFEDSQLWSQPIVKQDILHRLMRRYAQAGTRKDLLTCSQLLKLSPSDEYSKLLMRGFEEAFQGRRVANLPDELIDP